jgi:hypothetical protein
MGVGVDMIVMVILPLHNIWANKYDYWWSYMCRCSTMRYSLLWNTIEKVLEISGYPIEELVNQVNMYIILPPLHPE